MQWFIAVINGHAKTLELPLDFLGVGSSRSTELRDSKDKPDAWIAESTKRHPRAASASILQLEEASSAGFVSNFNAG